MNCAWKELLSILPMWMRQDVDQNGREELRELRLRKNAPPELVLKDKIVRLSPNTSQDDLSYIINSASRYSPWAASTIARGYLTAYGGHRIGICGEVVCKDGISIGIHKIQSLCIRVARDFHGILKQPEPFSGSILILGAPGWGKTTLLRDLSRRLAEKETVCVVDEREELFPDGFIRGKRMDVLSACPKSEGINMVLRTMSPAYIAVDEITEEEDCYSILRASNCGVHLLATAHAASLQEFQNRHVYRSILQHRIFQTVLVLHKDQSYNTERMTEWI